jgi:hypothetical protein
MWKVCFTLAILLLMPSLLHSAFSDTSNSIIDEPETYKRISAVYAEINSANSGPDSSIPDGYAPTSSCTDASQNSGYYQCMYKHYRNDDQSKFPGGIAGWTLETDLPQGDMAAHQKSFDDVLAYYSKQTASLMRTHR